MLPVLDTPAPKAPAGPLRKVNPLALLSPEDLERLRRRSDLKGLWSVFTCWAWIAAAMAAYAVWPSPATLLAGILVVGGRQLGLAVLMHDAAHKALTRSSGLNDHLGQWWCGVPVGADLFAYRRYHLKHHRHVQQPEDPDLVLSAPFPVSRASLRRKIVRDLTGQTFFKQRSAQFRNAFGPAGRPWSERMVKAVKRLGPFYGITLAGLAVFAAAGRADLFVLLWLLPMATWSMMITRIRNIAEHAVVPDNDDPLRNARTTRAGPLTRLILAPYAVNYHVEHHLFMWVPHYNLSHLHRILMKKGVGPSMEIQPDYLTVLRRATHVAA
ncbi:MAG: fatty acid desaturase family protein [Alphaproteobacteria bacterium]